VSVVDNKLEIRAEVRREEEVKREAYYRRERYYRGFHRRISLPAPVDPAKARATYENGVLTVRLPKLAKEERHRIEIE
ncbi:MAG TPA: Hsp20/alpha crystallin family protein, partial [Candidatus Bathyarchaeota archaeon]|nr:Hsp20/alpha crystallin family protein [Candidatus Bathyarchaeota archaeon]